MYVMMMHHTQQQASTAYFNSMLCSKFVIKAQCNHHPEVWLLQATEWAFSRVVCRGFRLLQQSREMWSNLMKAAWTWADGNLEDTSIRTCAEHLVKVLINIAGSLTTRGKAVESEAVLREALLVSRQHLNMHVKGFPPSQYGLPLTCLAFAYLVSCGFSSVYEWLPNVSALLMLALLCSP